MLGLSNSVFKNLPRGLSVQSRSIRSALHGLDKRIGFWRVYASKSGFSSSKLHDQAQVPSSSANNTANAQTRTVKLVYQSKFGKKVKMLRRVSLISSLLSCCMLPAAVYIDSGIMPVVGQVALVSTVMFSSLSSTAMLHVVVHPYVTELYEIFSPSSVTITAGKEVRKFEATRVDMMGNDRCTEFSLSEVEANPSHPFASFKLKNGGYFYIFGKDILDGEIKYKLTKER